jgi:DNA (cytosine-5)-methyltransferase 3A
MKNILSLFDGMSCGQIALNKLGVQYDTYYASEIDKHAIKVTQHNYPDTVQLGDVTKWREWEIDWSTIDLLFAGSPCFVKGTMVLTTKGQVPIEDVKIGDFVYTHKNRFCKVLRVGGKPKENIYTLSAQGILNTETTQEHPYYTREAEYVWDANKKRKVKILKDPKWVKASELSKYNYIAQPIIKTETNKYNLSKEECFILGRYIADGHTRKDFRKSENRPNNRNWQLILSIGKGKEFETSINFSFYKHGASVHRMVFSNKRLVQIAESECGSGALNKKIGINLLNLPVDYLKVLVDGILSGDGSFRNNDYRVTSVSKRLVQDLSLAVIKCYKTAPSITYSKRPPKHVIEGRVVNQNDTYTIQFCKFKKKQVNYVACGDFVWTPVRNVIVDLTNQKQVFNIEVENDNSYLANNAVVHNCQGFSFAGKQLAFDDPRSALFFVFVDIWRHIQSHNPNAFYLLENVKMKKNHEAVISKYMNVAPIEINSALLSAQNRKRLYWTNIANEPYGLFGDMQCTIAQPKDKGMLLRDVLETEVDEKYFLSDKMLNYFSKRAKNFNQGKVNVREKEGKASTLTASMASCDISDNFIKLDTKLKPSVNQDKSNCFTAGGNSGGLHSDMDLICVAQRGRNPENPKSRKAGLPTEQMLEPRHDGKTFCLTTVQKDNLVMQLNPSKESGNAQPYQQNRFYSTDGISPCLNTDNRSPAILVPEATKKGYAEVNPGECFDLTMPDSKTRRGRLMENKSNCLTASKFDFLQYTQDFKIRRLTPLECERLQTVPDQYTSVVSDTQRYKMLGNGWTVDVIAYILSHIK